MSLSLTSLHESVCCLTLFSCVSCDATLFGKRGRLVCNLLVIPIACHSFSSLFTPVCWTKWCQRIFAHSSREDREKRGENKIFNLGSCLKQKFLQVLLCRTESFHHFQWILKHKELLKTCFLTHCFLYFWLHYNLTIEIKTKIKGTDLCHFFYCWISSRFVCHPGI